MEQTTTTPTKEQRFVGGLLGMACCDAVGTAVEFKPPGSFPPVKGMRGGGVFGLNPGQWTDDTSMGLCIVNSLLEKKQYDPVDIMTKFKNWWFKGYMSSTGACFDIGNTTKKSLLAFKPSNPYPGKDHVAQEMGGNGSIMRLVGIPLFFSQNPAKAIEMAADSSLLTHGDKGSVSASRYMAALIVGALQGATKEQLLSNHFVPQGLPNDYWTTHPLISSRIEEIASGSFKLKNPPEIKGEGSAGHTLEAALWAFYHTNTFEDGCLQVVNLGDDADSTAAVYGQIAGTFYGEEAIPKDWRKTCYWSDRIRQWGLDLHKLAEAEGSH